MKHLIYLDIYLIIFKINNRHYLRQFFFDVFFFLCIIFLCLITDSFQEIRKKAWDNENDKLRYV